MFTVQYLSTGAYLRKFYGSFESSRKPQHQTSRSPQIGSLLAKLICNYFDNGRLSKDPHFENLKRDEVRAHKDLLRIAGSAAVCLDVPQAPPIDACLFALVAASRLAAHRSSPARAPLPSTAPPARASRAVPRTRSTRCRICRSPCGTSARKNLNDLRESRGAQSGRASAEGGWECRRLAAHWPSPTRASRWSAATRDLTAREAPKTRLTLELPISLPDGGAEEAEMVLRTIAARARRAPGGGAKAGKCSLRGRAKRGEKARRDCHVLLTCPPSETAFSAHSVSRLPDHG
eukprot:IDg1756t1